MKSGRRALLAAILATTAVVATAPVEAGYNFLRIKRAGGGAYQCVNAQATALIARMNPAPSKGRARLIDECIGKLVSAGIWSKLDAFYIIAAHSSQAALLNWVGTALASGTMTTSGAPVFVVDRGYFTDGLDDSLNFGFAPSNCTQFQQNSAMAYDWCRKPERDPVSSSFGLETGTGFSITARSSADQITFRMNSSTAVTSNAFTVNNQFGMTAVDRSSSTACKIYRDAVDTGATNPATSTSTTRSSTNIRLGRTNSVYGRNQFCAAGMGAHLTAEHVVLHGAVAAFLEAIGCTALTETTSTIAMTSAQLLPDGANGAAAGKGWTNCGLDVLPDGTLINANAGDQTGPPNVNGGVIHTSADSTTILHQWAYSDMGLDTSASIQGIAWENIESGGIKGNIYLAQVLAGVNTIYKVQITTGYAVGTVTSLGARTDANGVAYDSLRDRLVLVRNGSTPIMEFVSKADLSVITSFTLPIATGANYDMVWYDAANDRLLVTYGANGTDGQVERWQMGTDFGGPYRSRLDTLTGADCIEGVIQVGSNYLENNDGYRHTGSPALNRVLTFPAPL